MEIERKFLIQHIPFDLSPYPFYEIEQGYLCTNPVIRIRKKNDDYIFTCKSSGLMSREEYEMPLTKETYYHLKEKIDGNLIKKTRYLIPYSKNLTIELDIFSSPIPDLILAEIEFSTEAEAHNFNPPDWFSEDVTFSGKYHNNYLSNLSTTSQPTPE